MFRRDFIKASAVATALVAGTSPVAAQTGPNEVADFGFVGPEDDPEFGPKIRGEQAPPTSVGSHASRHNEVAMAFRLLFNAPRSGDHMDVATYFANLQEKNADRELYRSEWRTRANPLIVGFFSMTNTEPGAGDQVRWCAAFVSFCLYASGKKGKFSALSGAYRSYGSATDRPSYGDVVVFRKRGDEGAKGFGHVGFYLDHDRSSVTLLGGNQRGDSGTTGAVTDAVYKKDGDLVLHGYRRVAG